MKQTLLSATVIFLLHSVGNCQQRQVIPEDSTKLPASLVDFGLYNSKDTNKKTLQFTFLTKERPDAIYSGHGLDAIHLYSGNKFISFTQPVKDTLCFDSTQGNYCKWIYTFEVNQRQDQFLRVESIDKLDFISKDRSQQKVYLLGADRELFQGKFRRPD